jgi:hypothetical protein
MTCISISCPESTVSTVQFQHPETGALRKWGEGGKKNDEGVEGYEASTCFMARDVRGKIPVPNTSAVRTLATSVPCRSDKCFCRDSSS